MILVDFQRASAPSSATIPEASIRTGGDPVLGVPHEDEVLHGRVADVRHGRPAPRDRAGGGFALRGTPSFRHHIECLRQFLSRYRVIKTLFITI